MNYYISDLHLFHEAAIRFDDRPFRDLEEMHTAVSYTHLDVYKRQLWVMGYRISEYYKVTENTKRILKVQLIRKEFA